ncbi:MAG: alpha/beta hydrolase [Burkholderiaceae bacterium]
MLSLSIRTRPLVRLSLMFSTLAGVLTGCSGAGSRIIDALTPSSGYVETHDIAYGDGARRKLDVYVPATLAAGAKAPVVVFFYGGSWRTGSKDDYHFVADALTSRGIVTVIADYRLYPEVSYPDFLDDTAAAVAWTFREIDRYGGDTKRVFIAGHSAGAYNAAMVAFDARWLARYGIEPKQLRGFVGLAGPYNFLPIKDEGVKEVFHWPDTPADSQPINHVTRDSIPSLLIAAKNDTFVYPEKNTEPMAERLRAAGAEVAVDLHGGVNHVTLVGAMSRPLRPLAPVVKEFTNFVLTH